MLFRGERSETPFATTSELVVWRDAAQSAARLRPAECEPAGRTARESGKYSTAQSRRKERAGLNARWR